MRIAIAKRGQRRHEAAAASNETTTTTGVEPRKDTRRKKSFTASVLESTIHLVIGSSQTSQPATRADGERGDDHRRDGQDPAVGGVDPAHGHRGVEVQVVT